MQSVLTNKKNIEEILVTVGDLLIDDVKANLVAQGHKDTGKLLASIASRVQAFNGFYSLGIYFAKYGVYLDKGIKPGRIPFSTPTGRGGKSQYIEALTQYAKRKFKITTLKEARSAAFAIAKKQKKEGSPTRASSRFSKTGRRRFWFSGVVKEKEKDITQLLTKELRELIDKEITNILITSI